MFILKAICGINTEQMAEIYADRKNIIYNAMKNKCI